MIEETFGAGIAVEVEADVAKEADCKRVVAIAVEKYDHLDDADGEVRRTGDGEEHSR